MVKDGWLYGFGLIAVAVVAKLVTGSTWLVIPPVLLAVFFLWFFRDPERVIPQGEGLIISPADGVVTEAEWMETNGGSRLRVSIFLSVFNVHVNRVPISGTVRVVSHREGGFMNAMAPESVLTNEQTMVTIEGDGYEVSFKQIAGLLARRIVCHFKEGDRVVRGQRMGLIKFGSRCDVLMPAATNLRVSVGTRVEGGKTVLGILPMESVAQPEGTAVGGPA